MSLYLCPTVYQYNNLGRLIATTNQLNEVTLYSYDQFGQIMQITYPDRAPGNNERIEKITYDSYG